MKYLLALFLIAPLFFVSRNAGAVGPKLDTIYANKIYNVDNVPDSSLILGKPDGRYCHFTGNGPTIDIAFTKYKSNVLQTIKANSTILVWGKKDHSTGVDSSAGFLTFWFDDGTGITYNTDAMPVVLNDGSPISVTVPNMNFTYVELTLAVGNDLKGASSYLIDAIALVEDTTPPSSVPKQLALAQSISSYPNPFIQNTTIHFELETQGDVQLAVTDALGREVDRIQSGYLENGIHEIPLAIKTPGFYCVRLFVNGQPVGNPLKITSR